MPDKCVDSDHPDDAGDLEPDGLAVVVSQTREGWEARIGGGWWIAIGKTKEEAVKAVLGRYKRESEYF